MKWEHLTETEAIALLAFAQSCNKKDWASKKDWPEDFIPEDGKGPFRTTSSRGAVDLSVDLDGARKLLSSLLKPSRRTVDVVAFTNGEYQEISSTEMSDEAVLKQLSGGGRSIAKVVKEAASSALSTLGEAGKKAAKVAKAGATVALPTQGCPEPRLAKAEIKAREVLFAFLNEEQIEDFKDRQAFVSQGALTGHSYVITSRHCRDGLAMRRRQLFDADEQRPYCVHDYAVPAAEEMLALHLLLQIPERERYLRHLD